MVSICRFFPSWLQSKGLDPALIGLVVALPIIVRIMATAPLLSLADKSFGARRLLVCSHLGQLIGFPLLLLAQDSFTIIVLVGLVSVAQAAVIPGNDLVTTNAVQRYQGLNYGRLRGFGSISYFVANIVGGYLIGTFGANVVPVALTFIPILGIAATLSAIPSRSLEVPAASLNSPSPPATLPKVLWIVMIAAALTQGSHGAINAFGSIYWQSQGVPDAMIGYFWAAGVIAEIGVFMVLGRAVGSRVGVGIAADRRGCRDNQVQHHVVPTWYRGYRRAPGDALSHLRSVASGHHGGADGASAPRHERTRAGHLRLARRPDDGRGDHRERDHLPGIRRGRLRRDGAARGRGVRPDPGCDADDETSAPQSRWRRIDDAALIGQRRLPILCQKERAVEIDEACAGRQNHGGSHRQRCPHHAADHQ